jgi:hypothetical protein
MFFQLQDRLRSSLLKKEGGKVGANCYLRRELRLLYPIKLSKTSPHRDPVSRAPSNGAKIQYFAISTEYILTTASVHRKKTFLHVLQALK